MTRGEPAVGTRDFALHPCIRLAPCWGRTMKKSFASAARLRGGGPILTNGSMTVFWLGSPPPRIVIGQPGKEGFRLACRNSVLLCWLSCEAIRRLAAVQRHAGLHRW